MEEEAETMEVRTRGGLRALPFNFEEDSYLKYCNKFVLC